MTSVVLVGEDELCLALLDRLLLEVTALSVFRRVNTEGFGALKRDAANYAATARFGLPVVALADLDESPCAGRRVSEWLPGGGHEDFLLRIAVREAEAWVLADRSAFASHFVVKPTSIPACPDDCTDPKRELLTLVRRKPRWRAMLPDGRHRTGPAYNDALTAFVRDVWSPTRAEGVSPSLRRSLGRIRELAARKQT